MRGSHEGDSLQVDTHKWTRLNDPVSMVLSSGLCHPSPAQRTAATEHSAELLISSLGLQD